jgi:hypothetical protein
MPPHPKKVRVRESRSGHSAIDVGLLTTVPIVRIRRNHLLALFVWGAMVGLVMTMVFELRHVGRREGIWSDGLFLMQS